MMIINKRYTARTSLLVAAAAIALVLFSCHATAQDQGTVLAQPTRGSDAVGKSESINVVKNIIVQVEKCQEISESFGNGPDIASCNIHYSRAMVFLAQAITDLQDNNAKSLKEHLKNADSEFNACYQEIKDMNNSPLIPLTETLQEEVQECMGKFKVDLTGEFTFIPVPIIIPTKGFSMAAHHSHSGKASASIEASKSGKASHSGSASGSGGGSSSGSASGSSHSSSSTGGEV